MAKASKWTGKLSWPERQPINSQPRSDAPRQCFLFKASPHAFVQKGWHFCQFTHSGHSASLKRESTCLPVPEKRP